MTEFKNVLVATDFGPSSNAALEIAIDLAHKYGATLNVVHTYDIPSYTYAASASVVDLLGPIIEVARAEFDAAMKTIMTRVPSARGFLRFGVPWQEILSVQEETAADLIVMGTHGRKGLPRAFLGSIAEKVVRLSPVPVLTVRAK